MAAHHARDSRQPTTETNSTPKPGPLRELATVVAMALLGISCFLVWLLPSAKDNGVFGRLSYGQFLLAVVLTACFVCLVVVVLSPTTKRRIRVFQLTSIWLGIVVAGIISELAALFLPPDYMSDNPWYMFTVGGSRMLEDSQRLRFVRPPNLYWHGLSRGDFAIQDGRVDPYAREVTFQTDHEGFRNSRKITKADIVFIGDSFTEAGNMPENETFVLRTSKTLNMSARNLGCASYGPLEERIVLSKYGLNCQPHTVVWQICENNDLKDALNFQRWVELGRPNIAPTLNRNRAAIWRSRSPSLHMYRFCSKKKPWPVSGVFHDNQGKSHVCLFEGPRNEAHVPKGHPGWPLLISALRHGHIELERRGIRLIVLLIPKKLPVMVGYVEFTDSTKRILPKEWGVPVEESLSWHLKGLCNNLGVQYVDATQRLRQSTAMGELVYLPLDSHLSSRGHAVVAELLAQAIKQPPARKPKAKASPPQSESQQDSQHFSSPRTFRPSIIPNNKQRRGLRRAP